MPKPPLLSPLPQPSLPKPPTKPPPLPPQPLPKPPPASRPVTKPPPPLQPAPAPSPLPPPAPSPLPPKHPLPCVSMPAAPKAPIAALPLVSMPIAPMAAFEALLAEVCRFRLGTMPPFGDPGGIPAFVKPTCGGRPPGGDPKTGMDMALFMTGEGPSVPACSVPALEIEAPGGGPPAPLFAFTKPAPRSGGGPKAAPALPTEPFGPPPNLPTRLLRKPPSPGTAATPPATAPGGVRPGSLGSGAPGAPHGAPPGTPPGLIPRKANTSSGFMAPAGAPAQAPAPTGPAGSAPHPDLARPPTCATTGMFVLMAAFQARAFAAAASELSGEGGSPCMGGGGGGPRSCIAAFGGIS
mmetsp:Transcript_6948/g.19691  ORF Transcript_6948/g.19691 Transcript_6948/m.19691 type:complete len:352 (+) Transcript_6948:318-1373(+)